MAITLQLTDGTTSVDLAYDASAQTVYRNTYQTELSNLQPQESWHRPHGASRELVESVDDLLQVFLNLVIVDDTGIDEVLDAIVDVRRLINQARRYSLHGDVDRVDLKIQRDGATNATMWPVVNGFVDDSRAHYEAVAQESDLAFDVTVALSVGPYGEAESAIGSKNFLLGPHFLEDSDGDGVADGWNEVGTPTTTQIATSIFLIGGKSQNVVVPNTGAHGIRTDSVTAGIGSTAGAYIWINEIGSVDPIRIRLTDGSANIIDEQEFDASNPTGFDKSVVKVDENGVERTWYRYKVSGQNNTAADFRIYVLRRDADATQETNWLVDGAYMRVGTSFTPDYWVSSFSIANRYDPTNANPSQINYVDVWGVPGDAPALVDIELDWTAITGTPRMIIAGRGVDGTILAADLRGWIDSDELSTDSALNAAWTTGTGTSEDHFHRLTQDGTASKGQGDVDVTLTGDAALQLLASPQRCFGICRSSTTTASFSLAVTVTGTDFVDSGEKNLGSTGQWEVVDFGLLNTSGAIPRDQERADRPSVAVELLITDLPASGSDTADLDALIFLPVNYEFAVFDFGSSFTVSNFAHIRGQHEDAFVDETGYNADRLGSLWHLAPGNNMNRLRFIVLDNDNAFTLTDAANVTLTVTPRTRHLLGTT